MIGPTQRFSNWRPITAVAIKLTDLLQPGATVTDCEVMARLAIGILLLTLLQLRLGVESVNYEVIGNEMLLLTTCEGEENNMDISELVDFSQLNFVFEEDYETIHASGKIVMKVDLPPLISVHIEIYRMTRDEWVTTPISLRRDDFCKSLKNPFEPWHFFIVSQIPKEERICPPKAGHVYTLHNITNRIRLNNLPYWGHIDGDIKVVMHFEAGTMKACVIVFLTVRML